MEMTNTHLFVANTDVKSKHIMMSGKYSLAVGTKLSGPLLPLNIPSEIYFPLNIPKYSYGEFHPPTPS